MDCGGLSDIPNGEVDYTSSTVGSTATYTCNTGFELVGEMSRSCLANGEWSGTTPMCVSLPTPTIVTSTPPPVTTPGAESQSQHNNYRGIYHIFHMPIITTHTGLRIELDGTVYPNGSTVYIDDIGEDSNALLCHTSRPDCCSSIGSRYGEFYYPDGTTVGIMSKNEPMYRNRGSQLIRLNRRSDSSSTPPMGWYRCEIPSVSGEQQSISINITGTGLLCIF